MGEDKGQSYASKFRRFTPPPPQHYSSTMGTNYPQETFANDLDAQHARILGFHSQPLSEHQRPWEVYEEQEYYDYLPQESYNPQPPNDMQVIGDMLAKILTSFEEDEKNEKEMKQGIESLYQRIEAIESHQKVIESKISQQASTFFIAQGVSPIQHEEYDRWYFNAMYNCEEEEGLKAFIWLDNVAYEEEMEPTIDEQVPHLEDKSLTECDSSFSTKEQEDSSELDAPRYCKSIFIKEDDEEKPLVIVDWAKDVRNYAYEDLSKDFLGIQTSISLGEDDEEWLTPKSRFEDGNEGVSTKSWDGYEDPYLFMPLPNKFISFRAYLEITLDGNLHDPSTPLNSYALKGSVRLYDVHLKIGGRQFLWDLKID